MRAALGYFSPLEHDDLVELIKSGQIVSDQQQAAAGRDGQQVGHQRMPVSGIQVGRRLVQHQHGGIGQHCAGQRESLALAAGHAGAVAADTGVEAVRQ